MTTIKKTTIKEVFENDNWIIVSVMQGLSKCVRIDAKRRFPVCDKSNFFSIWSSASYANRLARENYSKNLNDFNCYKY